MTMEAILALVAATLLALLIDSYVGVSRLLAA
jgi:hypothetical protein